MMPDDIFSCLMLAARELRPRLYWHLYSFSFITNICSFRYDIIISLRATPAFAAAAILLRYFRAFDTLKSFRGYR